MSCDDERPCRRCIKRGISHLCHDKESAGDVADTRGQAKAGDGGGGSGDGSGSGGGMWPAEEGAAAAIANSRLHSPAAAAADSTTGPSAVPIVAPMQAPMLSARKGSTPSRVVTSPMYMGDASEGPRSLELTAPISALAMVSSSTPGVAAAAATASMELGPAGGTLGGLYGTAGFRLDPGSLLLFGGDIANNESSVLSEFLESLQRGARGAESTGSDMRQSNLSSEPPSIRGVSSPVAEAAMQGAAFQGAQAAAAAAAAMAAANGGGHVRAPMPASADPAGAGRRLPQAAAVGDDRAVGLPTISELMGGRSGEGVTQTERFVLTAADPNDGTSEDKLRQIINAKYEAGILKPYNYVGGYARMQRFMETHLSQPSIVRILGVVNTIRPTFRTIAQSLTDIDLLLVEEGFERLLLDYDNVFNAFGVPACLWRRTGEIYKANREFADLVGVPLSSFHEGRMCIYEIMSESSTVNYWEKYGEIAFDASQKAVLTSCVMQTLAPVRTQARSDSSNSSSSDSSDSGNSVAGQPGRSVRCCFSFTLRRDKYKIPIAIVGNFIPAP
ncbi:Transcription factor [Coemansia biformis]|uniref:Transcription factor n=1 Tax=Coemansia biformis TaxID=1286918 RepID=A0A9W7YBV3_9FUNG|nr:Transcription factor [Coemansia biformis]